MRRLILLTACLLAAACSSATAPRVSLSGHWVGGAAPADCTYGLYEDLVLQQKGDSLSGTYTLDDCDLHMTAGVIDNASVQGNRVTFDSGWDVFTGTLSANGDTLQGTLTPENVSATLTRE